MIWSNTKIQARIIYMAGFCLMIGMITAGCSSSRPKIPITTTSSLTASFTNSPIPSATRTITPRPTFTPTVTRLPSDTPTKTLTPIAQSVCPLINPALSFILPNNQEEIEQTILKYLSAGGDPINIKKMIGNSQDYPIDSLLIADLDRDSIPEISVAVRDLTIARVIISIYRCDSGDYQLMKSMIFDEVSGVHMLLITHLFDTELKYLILREDSIYGWNEIYKAIGWTGSDWQSITLGNGNFISEIALFDQNADRVLEVFIQSDYGSREIIDTYYWNSKQYVLSNTEYGPSKTRVDYLMDAERALDKGNPMLAITYYEVAARDDSLINIPSMEEAIAQTNELAQPYQQSYAYFRVIVLWFYLDRPDIAMSFIKEMADKFPEKTPGHEFVLAAYALATSYERGPGFIPACTDAVVFLDNNYPNVVNDHLGGWYDSIGLMINRTSDICNVY